MLPLFDDDEGDEEAAGRHALACEILLEFAAKGKVRLYARNGCVDTSEETLQKYPIRLSPEFVGRAEYDFEKDQGPTLYDEEDSYYDLAVDYNDLTREFWGEEHQNQLGSFPEYSAEQPSPLLPAIVMPVNRRGRRPRYPWPDFAAELVRRSLSGPNPANQAVLERHMQEWCAATWGAEPAASEIRNWVRPTFRVLASHQK